MLFSALGDALFEDWCEVKIALASSSVRRRIPARADSPDAPSTFAAACEDPSFVEDVLEPLAGDLTPIAPRDVDDVQTFTRAPRNCALIIRFNDLLDPNTVTPENIRVVTGNPPTIPYFTERLRLERGLSEEGGASVCSGSSSTE